MVVRNRAGAKPGKVLALGETTASIEAIRRGLPPYGSRERVVEIQRRMIAHVPVPVWDQVRYDLCCELEQAARGHFGRDWYKHIHAA